MPPKPKPNAYSIFVGERCKQTGIAYAHGFKKFSDEWKDLDDLSKEAYKEQANVEKATLKEEKAASLSPPKQHSPPKNRTAPSRGIKRLDVEAEDGEVDSGDDDGYMDDEPSSGGSAGLAIKRIFLGDESCLEEDEYKYISVEEMEGIVPVRLNFDEFPTTEEESLGNINAAYRNLTDVKELTIFSFSCVPVIYAAGHKKGATLPLNFPVELGVTYFSLEDGLELSHFLHAYVDPGPLPAGSSCDADAARADRHGLPYANQSATEEEASGFFDNGRELRSDYLRLYRQVLNFTGYDGSSAHLLMPLCSRRADLAVNEACMKWLHFQATKQRRETGGDTERLTADLPEFTFAALEDFTKLALLKLAQTSGRSQVVLSDEIVRHAFSHEFHKQLHLLNCSYHRRVVSVKNCALGAAREGCYSLMRCLQGAFRLGDDSRFVYLGGPHHDSEDDE